MIELANVTKTYTVGRRDLKVLDDVSLNIKEGEMVAIMGPSGSGKSTLMHIIGLLDRPSAGSLTISGSQIDLNLPDRRLARLRSELIGFVFQSFFLLPRQTALTNVLMPSVYTKLPRPEALKRAKKLLKDFGLADRMTHTPAELSGGEKQRVAISRALINDPQIILADEPTGNLDSESGQEVMAILKRINQAGKTLIIVTHDQGVAEKCGRTIRLHDGQISRGTK